MLICLSKADIAINSIPVCPPCDLPALGTRLWVMNQAQSVVLHPQELNVIRDSLDTLWEPIMDRSAKLRCECINYCQS
jgi:hypothetical protein